MSFYQKVKLLLFIFLLPNCKQSCPKSPTHKEYNIIISDNFNQEQKEIIKNGTNFWLNNNNLKFSFDTKNNNDFIIIDKKSFRNPYKLGSHSQLMNNHYVLLSQEDSLNNLKLRNIVIHEIGHAIGISHVKNQNSIMFPLILKNKYTLTSIDKLELCKVSCCIE